MEPQEEEEHKTLLEVSDAGELILSQLPFNPHMGVFYCQFKCGL